MGFGMLICCDSFLVSWFIILMMHCHQSILAMTSSSYLVRALEMYLPLGLLTFHAAMQSIYTGGILTASMLVVCCWHDRAMISHQNGVMFAMTHVPVVQAVFTVVPVRCVRAAAHCCLPARGRTAGMKGQQLCDAICICIFASAVFFLRLVNAGALYFWMKDLTQEFLKLHVIATAVEILDKVSAYETNWRSCMHDQAACMSSLPSVVAPPCCILCN